MDFEQICRLCAAEKLKLRDISGDERHAQLPDQLRTILQVQYDENDALPQKVCKPCVTAMQRIQDTLEEYRANDMRMRKQLLGLEEVEVKLEELDGSGADKPYNVKDVKIEVLEQRFELQSPTEEIEQAEEWLEDDFAAEAEQSVEDNMSESLLTDVNQDSIEVLEEDETPEKPPALKRKRAANSSEPKKQRRKRGSKQPENPNRPRLNDFKCYICKSDPLGSAKDLLDHLAIHNDQLPYTCTLCVQEPIEIRQLRSLNLHLKMHEQPIKCAYCDRRYTNERARDYHVQSFHLGDNAPCPSTCDLCGKVCPSALSLKAHRKRHTISFNCEFCSKGFAEKSKLKRHISRVHERSGSYECTMCDKRLTTIDAYEHHVRTIHEGRRDHECEVCGRTFTTAAFLRMHQKHYEGGVCKPKNNWTPYYTTRINEEGIKLYSCKLCQKEDMRAISEHLRVHFPEEYECPICLIKLPRKSSFDRHRLTHSEITHHCFICKKSFLSPRKMSSHLAKAHGIGQILETGTELPLVSDEEIEFDVVG
ncbi:zinc finger protein 37 homolog [Aedes albopictus]|uniref:C2h2-type zn-finger protein n=1 Tax=Aedes albopictus TaxID=7160 RepID=A0ABM1ZDM1_AEDAL